MVNGGLKPGHKTIANFRRNNKRALKEVLRQCVKLCIKLDLIEGNTLFVDGSKMRVRFAQGKFRCKCGDGSIFNLL
jgi:transposase